MDLWHGRCFEERAKANLNGKRSRTMEGSYSRSQHTHVDSEGIAHGLFCTKFRGFVAGNLHWRSEIAARRSLGLISLDGVTVTIQIIAFETKMDCNKTAFSYDTSRTSSLIYII